MSQNYTKCKFSHNGKVIWARACSSKLVEYYYDDDATKHIYKVQISFFKTAAKRIA